MHCTQVYKAGSTYLPILTDHDIVRVAITNAQYVSGHTVASTGEGEVLDGLVQLAAVWILLLEPLQQKFPIKSSTGTPLLLLNLGNGGGIQNDFNQANLVPSGQTAIGNHSAHGGRGREGGEGRSGEVEE